MKPYKFLIPVAIAAGALAGNAARANVTVQPEAKIEQVAGSSAAAVAHPLFKSTPLTVRANTLLLK